MSSVYCIDLSVNFCICEVIKWYYSLETFYIMYEYIGLMQSQSILNYLGDKL